MKKSLVSCLVLSTLFTAQAALPLEWEPLNRRDRRNQTTPTVTAEYLEAIRHTTQMVSDPQAQQLANQYGLNLLNLTWEDTGRFKNSAVGPNISDMTIQVATEDPRSKQIQTALMPVIRFPNFSDTTGEIDPRDFTLLVGNEQGKALQRVSLYDFLKEPTRYLTHPDSWLGKNKSLLADRDSKVLVSAQAAFLPVPKSGKATFNPVLFNYQSVSGDPAVLTILATREGTSVTVIDNKRDAFAAGSSWGQRLFHNHKGERASLTGERLSDFKNNGGHSTTGANQGTGLSMVLLIQVPLKQKHPMRSGPVPMAASQESANGAVMSDSAKRKSDVEVAVIGHGELEGPFTEVDHLAIERDPKFPVRVTVQFYKATANGVVSAADLEAINQQINSVYKEASVVGSLVTAGETGRVTEYAGVKVQGLDWWNEFWLRHEQNTGENREEAMVRLDKLLGKQHRLCGVSELYLRQLLQRR